MKHSHSSLFICLIVSQFSISQVSLVKDINPGTNSSSPSNFFNYSGTLLFRANDGVNGVELWKSDGTNAGTVMVKNINAGTTASGNSNPANFILFNGEVYFTAGNGTDLNGTELWKTDGTNAGTVMVKDIRPGSNSGNPQNFAVLNPTTLLFAANDGTAGVELWKTDGTDAGTVMVKDYPGATGSISDNKVMGANAYQLQIVSATGRELYKSDGTLAGSDIVRDINPGTANGVGTELFVASTNTLYFSATDGTSGLELWKSDGTFAGTVMVKNINPGSANSSPRRFVELGGKIYFNATDGTNGTELWETDGTEPGTIMTANINTAPNGNSNPDQLAVVGGNLYFFAQEDGSTYDLYKYDGTTLTKLYDFNAPAATVLTNYILLGGYIYFAADSNGDGKRELWRTDGTPAGTISVSSINTSSPNPIGVGNLTLVGTKIFYSAEDAATGTELYVFDPALLSVEEERIVTKNTSILYPNPNDGKFFIKGIDKGSYLIYDLNGRVIAKGNFTDGIIEHKLSSGSYIVVVEDESGVSSYKMIIE